MSKVFTFVGVFTQQSKEDIGLIGLFIYTSHVSIGLQIRKKKNRSGL